MAYDRFQRKRQQSYGRDDSKTAKKGRPTGSSSWYKTKKVRDQRNSSVRADCKYWAATANQEQTYNLTTTGFVIPLAEIPQGNKVFEREGRAVQLTSIRMRGRIVPPTIDDQVSQNYYALVYDSANRGATPLITDIYGSSAASFPNQDNKDRFKIIRHWQRPVSSADNAGPRGIDMIIDEYIKLNDMAITWTTDATAGDIAGCAGGHLFLVGKGSNTDAGTYPTLRLNMLLNFKDV